MYYDLRFMYFIFMFYFPIFGKDILMFLSRVQAEIRPSDLVSMSNVYILKDDL